MSDGLICSDCPAAITVQSRTGRCRSCALAALNADPAMSEKRIAAVRKRYQDPATRDRATRRLHAAHAAARKDPVKRARIDRNIHIARARLNDPDVRRKFLAGRPAAGRKRQMTVMSWCPKSRWPEYFHLTRSKRILAPDARRMIEETFTPFDRQVVALQKGARLISRPDISDKREQPFSLASGSSLAECWS